MSEKRHQQIKLPIIKNKVVVALFLLFALVLTVSISMINGRPEMLYFCTIAVTLSSIALLYDSTILNSLVAGYFPLYVVVVTLTVLYPNWWAYTIHGLNLALSTIILVWRWKNMNPLLMFVSSIAYLAYNIEFKFFIIPPYADDVFFGNLLAWPLIFFAESLNLILALLNHYYRKTKGLDRKSGDRYS